MTEFYREIRKISDKVVLREGKENYKFVRWFIEYFKRLADEIRNQNADISDEELILKVKDRIIRDIKYFAIVKNITVYTEIFSLSFYIFFKKYTDNKNLHEFSKRIVNKEYDEIAHEFFELYDAFVEILKSDFGENSGSKLNNIMSEEEFKQKFFKRCEPYKDTMSKKEYVKLVEDLLQKMKKEAYRNLKSIYILNLQSIGEFFECTGSLEKLIKLQNNVLNKFLLFELKVKPGDQKVLCSGKKKETMDDVEKDNFEGFNANLMNIFSDIIFEEALIRVPDNFYIRDIFKTNVLKSLNLFELMALNCFWQNKYTKELENILRLTVACDSLNLWNQIFDGTINQYNISDFISDDEYKYILEKSTYILRYAQEEYKLCPQISAYEFSKTEEYLGKLQLDSAKYKRYFSKFKCKNDLEADVEFFLPIYMNMNDAYFSKTLSMYSLILNISEIKECKNYGIILSNLQEFKNENMCEIWIDYPKLSYPLRIHIEKDKLLNFLKKVKKNTALSIYKGKEDFFDNKFFFASNILFPISKAYSKTIVKLNKLGEKGNRYYKLISHLCLLANGKFPPHLKDKKKNNESVIIKQYIDLESLIIFDDKKESFYKLEDFNC